ASQRKDQQINISGQPEGIVYSALYIPQSEWDGSVPEVKDLYPTLDEVPAMWLRDRRAYRDPTRKEGIRKAVEYEAALRICCSGQETRFLPFKLIEENAEWSVVGLQSGTEVRYSNGQWEEMQLLLPGINDTK